VSSRSLRVLVVDQAVGVWGAQQYLLRLAPLLRESGIELVLAGPRSLELHDVWCDRGFDAIDLDIPVDRSIRSAGRPSLIGVAREARVGLKVARMISNVVGSEDYDAIWANAHWVHADASLAGRLCRTPVVLHLHEEAAPGVGQLLRTAAVGICTNAVAVSQGVAAGLPEFAQRKTEVIPNGVDTQLMSPAPPHHRERLRALRGSLDVGDDDVMVLAATRLDPVKRIEDLIAVVHALDDPRTRLVVAGSTSGYPEYADRVRGQAQTLLPGRVNFCGNREDMADMFRASDVVIHAGVVEGMPLGLLEAQSCGKPVVAYDVAGVPEAVIHTSTGFLAASRDVDGLRGALGKLVQAPALRAAMGAAARAHVLSHHRIETQAARNGALLKKLCDTPRAQVL
jgi:glycosyltransferase involved in cell wall biosynthesis